MDDSLEKAIRWAIERSGDARAWVGQARRRAYDDDAPNEVYDRLSDATRQMTQARLSLLRAALALAPDDAEIGRAIVYLQSVIDED